MQCSDFICFILLIAKIYHDLERLLSSRKEIGDQWVSVVVTFGTALIVKLSLCSFVERDKSIT